MRPALADLTAAIAFAGIAVLASINLAAADGAAGATPLWLVNGFVLAVLVRLPSLSRPGSVIGASLGIAAANLVFGSTLALALGVAAACAIEIAIGLTIVGRLAHAGTPAHSSRTIGIILLAAAVSPLAAAPLYGLLAHVLGKADVLSVGVTRYVADALGTAIIGPLVLSAWCDDCRKLLRSGRKPDMVLIGIAAAGVSTLVFEQGRYPFLFVILPVLTAAAFRLRFLGAAIALGVVGVIAWVETTAGNGPIANRAFDAAERLLLLQAFLAVAVIATFPVAAILVERETMLGELAARERRFREMTAIAPIAMIQTDAEGRIRYGNDRWQALAGSHGRSHWLDAVTPESREDANRSWENARCARMPMTGEFDFIRAGAESGWVSLAMAPELDGVGQLIGWVGTALDIEERRIARERLSESERKYRLLADTSSDMIVRIGMDDVRTYVSPASQRLFGFAPEELAGTNLAGFVHPDDRAHVVEHRARLLAGNAEQVCEYRHRHKDGSYRWAEATAWVVRDEHGAPQEFVATVRDVSLRRSETAARLEAAAQLEEGARLLRMAEMMAGVGHWRLDADTHEIFWSDEVCRIHERAPGDIPPLEEAIAFYHPDDRPEVETNVARALSEGRPWSMRTRLSLPSGRIRHVDSVGQVERAPGGAIVGVVGVFRDVTDEVIAERVLIEARDEARAAAEAKSAFLATMSHEIRTPMTGVLGMIELLRADPAPDQRERFFDNLEQSATLLMTVLDDILDFSKIESGNLTLENVDFDLIELSRTTLDLFHNAASNKGLLLSMNAPVGRDVMVRGDPVRLQQIISNLVSNAIKFTPTGRIELRVGLEAQGAQRIVRCEVADTGVGIDQHAIASLFEPFVQADASTTRRFGGTGLGLAISQRLAQAMAGVIEVESAPGVGTTFRFQIVLAAPKDAVSRLPQQGEAPAPRPLSILLAEDNQINRALIEAIVRRDGHSVHCVENGALAVAAADQTAFDAILMDMQMPEMDGIAATRAIRAGSGRCAQTPIIALTADASADRRRFYDNVGLTDFLTKPLDTGKLLDRLRRIGESAVVSIMPNSASAGAVLLDESKIQEIGGAIGEAAMERLLDMLDLELETWPQTIARAIEQDDRAAILKEAHSLKGAALGVGAERVGQLAQRLEDAHLDGESLSEAAQAMAAACAATRHALVERQRQRQSA